jgi:hypothetical protein
MIMVLVGIQPAYAAESGDAPRNAVVRIILMVERTGNLVVNVTPSRAKLWRDNAEKPSGLLFKVFNHSPYSEVFWEVRFDEDSKVASEDYLGAIDIACGERSLVVAPENLPSTEGAEWPFAVTAYACFDGVKGPQKAISVVDPRVVWKD